MRFLRLHYLLVYGGVVLGTILGVRAETEPAIVGIAFGVGGGLSAGAFLAAILGGVPLAGGPAPRRRRPPGIFEEGPRREEPREE